MQVLGIDHYNLHADRELLDRLRAFYCDVVGLRAGERPQLTHFGYWLYAGDQAVLHLSIARDGESCQTFVDGTFNHVSFRCNDRKSHQDKLEQENIPYRVSEGSDKCQIFFDDPVGNGVELIFYEG